MNWLKFFQLIIARLVWVALFVALGHFSAALAWTFAVLGQLAIWIWMDGGIEQFLIKNFRTREIHKPEGLYLRRFYLSPRWSWVPFMIFLHNIRLDDDRNMHDHPWDFWSFILLGCYREWYMRAGKLLMRMAPAGTLLRNKAEHVHRVEIVRPVWSLVIAFRPRRMWGFWPEIINYDTKTNAVTTSSNFVDAATFLNQPGVQDQYPEDRISERTKRKLIKVALKDAA